MASSLHAERERLPRAFALLTEPANTGLKIGDIAMRVGSVEHSTFNRAFRHRFGDVPRAVRHAASAGGNGSEGTCV
jgi:transcriptional regulator GlxA family with amidase domain